MFSEYSYPILCTDRFIQTINFYEDHFDYYPVFETENYTVMKRRNWRLMHLAVMDSSHNILPERYRTKVSGMILNYPVHDVDEAYKKFYWEGLTIVSQPESTKCGRKHFFIEDPNGMLIDIAQNVPFELSGSDQPFGVVFSG